MSKLNDSDILMLQKEIEAKKDKIAKLKSKFAPETTCSYQSTTGSFNLHVQSINKLLTILTELISNKTYWEEACKLSKVELEFKHQGFTFEQWSHDILFLIDRHNLKQMEEELSEDIEFLDNLVSKETKNKAKFDKLKEKYAGK